jgi:hypothetical protein
MRLQGYLANTQDFAKTTGKGNTSDLAEEARLIEEGLVHELEVDSPPP